jgi:hypothetical protein
MKKRYVLRLGAICWAVVASAIFLPSASAGIIGTLFTGSAGLVTVTTTSITWNTDPGTTSAGTWNGEVANGTTLTFAGCAGGLGSAGCLFNGEGVDINQLGPFVNGVTVLPENDFLTFASNPVLDFTLVSVSPGSANTNCIGLAPGESCSVIAGSPIILTLLSGNRTGVALSFVGTATDGSGQTSYWTGGFSATLPTMTPADLENYFAANPHGSQSASNSGSFFVSTVPEPGTSALIGGALIGLATLLRRRKSA